LTSDRTGVHGWLLVLCRLLIVAHPVLLAAAAPAGLSAIAVRGAPVGAVLLLRLLVVAFGVAAGRALQQVRPAGVTLARSALLMSAATDVFVYTTPYYPSNRIPGDTPFYVAASLLYHAAWIAYLQRSRRVRQTFG
jgi:hypothetical protein